MAGIFGDQFDFVFGRGPEDIQTSGAFQQTGKVGKAFSDLLLERLMQSPEETETFRRFRGALGDQISRQGGAARQRLSDALVTGGSFDSGVRFAGIEDIDRAGIETFGRELNQLLLGLEDRRTQGVLPFLGGAAQENLGVQGLESQNILMERFQNMETFNRIGDQFAKIFSGGGIGKCWVARAIYGPFDVRWLYARHYVVNLAPSWFRRLYIRYGERVATVVRRSPLLKRALRPLFDSFVRKAQADG
jgi:hypothetical protein